MAALAKGLPIFCVPEQLRVTTMRFDVVHYRCRCQNTCGLAANTPRMPAEVELPRLLPSSVVATLVCCLPVVSMFFGMLFAVLLPIRYEPWTSGMCAGRLRSMRHSTISLSIWQAQLDLNQHQRFWRPSCFPYTMRLRPCFGHEKRTDGVDRGPLYRFLTSISYHTGASDIKTPLGDIR